MAGNLHQTLHAACAEVGILYRDVPPDGRWHDTDVEDDPRGRGDGRIKLFPDGQGGMVHNWKASDKPRTFFVDDGRTLSDEERAERDRRRQETIQRAEQELARERKRAADKTAALRKIVGPARPDHPYFARKLPGTTPPTTLFETTVEQITATIGYHPHSNSKPLTGRVLIAFVETSGKLVTAEFIDEAGRKSAVAGGPKGGGYWAAQALPNSDETGLILAIGEGVATVLSVKEATGHAVIAALSAGNLPKVATIMRERFPAARLVILGDIGKGQAKAEQAARDVGAALAVPRFPEGSTGTDWNDLAVLSGLDVVRGQIAAAITPAPATDTPSAKTYTLLTFDDLAVLPPMKWKIKGVLPDSGIAAIYGPSGSGKSFLSLDLGGALGSGREWFGHRVNTAPVVYLCLEGESGLRNRVAAYRTHHGRGSLANVRFIVESFDMLNGDPAALIRTIQAAGMENPVVMIDTLNRAAPGADENNVVDMGRIIAATKAIQSALGGLVVLIHHTGKDIGKGLRGHSSLHAALDAAISVSRDGEDRKWSIAKAKDGEDGKECSFSLKVYDLGEDEDGDPVTSCAILPGDPVDDASGQKKPKPPTGGNQKIAWTWLSAAFKARNAIPFDEAVREISGRLSVASDRRPERAREAITGLINRGLCSLLDGFLKSPTFSPNPEPYIYGFGNGDKKCTRSSPKSGKPGTSEPTIDNEGVPV